MFYLVELPDLLLLLHPQVVGLLHQLLRLVPGLQLQLGQRVFVFAGQVGLEDLALSFLSCFLDDDDEGIYRGLLSYCKSTC